MTMTKRRIILITPENQDKFKVGGLGKVTKLLENGLKEAAVEVKVVAPDTNIYGQLFAPKTEKNNRDLGLAAVRLINSGFDPDWVWVHDWGGIWSADEVKKYLPNTKVVWTIHSPILLNGYGYGGYNGSDKPIDWGDSFFDFGGLIKQGVKVSNKISAVSTTFAKNITRSQLFEEAKEIEGINNGIDLDEWKISNKNSLSVFKAIYKRRLQMKLGLAVTEVPVFVFISRLVGQKGLEILTRVLPKFLTNNPAQFLILGGGDKYWTNKVKRLERKFGDKLKAILTADFELPKELLRGADYLVLPSVSEPFGLVVAEAKRMGAVPIVSLVDGLADQVVDGKNGLGFGKYGANGLEEKLMEAVSRFKSEWQIKVAVKNILEVDSYQKMTQGYLSWLYEPRT